MQSRLVKRPGGHQRYRWLLMVSSCFALGQAAMAETYYVSPSGVNSLSKNPTASGSLPFALAGTGGGSGAAQSGDTVILEDGVYEDSPKGFTVFNSKVTFRAQHWHKASIINSKDSNLWRADRAGVTGDICQGMVFGPSTGLGWSGGGSDNWQFLDCLFMQNGGVGSGKYSIFRNCLFTDAYTNSFDVATDVTFKNCIARRGNRSSADDDSVGNKELYTKNLVFDGLVVYDTNGTSLWFDTSNDDWLVKNCTFFANHGGNDWFYCGVGKGISPTQFTGFGQDGEGLSVGMQVKVLDGSSANVGHASVVTAVSGSNPQTITVSPALPVTPASDDRFIVQQGRASSGDGLTTEANDNGTFDNNWTYCNTDRGFFDHASGGSRFGGVGGLIVTNNLFAYNGEGFDYMPDGRDDGPAVVKFNQFKFHPGTSRAFGSAGGSLGRYPGPLSIVFDYNVYDPDTSEGNWANWYPGNPAVVAGGLTNGSQPAGQDYLQNPATWNQDHHSIVAPVKFWGTPPTITIFPAANDTDWGHVFYPNNVFGLANSVHQIDDTDGAIDNTIDAAVVGHKAGDIVMLPVSAHTPINGATCEVYDLNGRWVTLNVPLADQGALLASIPPYVSCVPGNKTATFKIRAVLTSVDPYNMTATYTQTNGTAPTAPALIGVTSGSRQNSLVWTAAAGASGYNIYRGTSHGKTAAPIAAGITTTSYTDSTTKNGTAYYYTVQAANTYGISPSSNEMSAKPHQVTGSLIGSDTIASTSAYDLTTLGAIDWRHWGDMGGPDYKITGGGQISELKQFGTGKFGRWTSKNRNVSWTDNVNMSSNSGDQSYVWSNSVSNSGWTFTVPADTTKRTLNILWSGSAGASGTLNAHLSDGSATDYNAKVTVPVNDSPMTLETITYNAAKPGQTLTITITSTTPDKADGPSVDLQAVYLH